MDLVDLQPAADRMKLVLRGIPDDRLGAPTPCPMASVGDLVDHVGGLTLAFTAAAAKDLANSPDDPPQPDAANLDDDWRTRIPEHLDALATAWRDPEAWTGMTRAGGVDLPGEVGGLVALNELVVHGWDLARATGQPYDPDDASLSAALAFVEPFSADMTEAGPDVAFGPPVAVADDAPLLDRLVGLTGRDPGWRAPEAAA